MGVETWMPFLGKHCETNLAFNHTQTFVLKSASIAIFASGSGSNAEAIIRYFSGHPTIKVAAVFTNNQEAGVISRAHRLNIPCFVFSNAQFESGDLILGELSALGITHLVLAGFLRKVPVTIISQFPVVNIHPALLPKYGGKGMYGAHVHRAVLAAGEVETGISIHRVNEHYDEGGLLFQATYRIQPYDTPETLATAIHQLEHRHFAEQIEKWINNQ